MNDAFLAGLLVAAIPLGIALGIVDSIRKEWKANVQALESAADPDADIFATLLAREWSLDFYRYEGGEQGWRIGGERASTPAEAWRKACAVYDARKGNEA